ncbi:D-beta-hydroxybutyrate dehydrogenase, mitochondrial-like [Penaeus japonicus]|uniref:D-beta-hydroxybutyrate dehydrogenase, mitochondrial-like n=1 Tax=Penaeus japonicus TaxID=27405 RepID=UPI001C70CEA0|nr:D-beta-hydroxybutyrate dehydrogenase, mitochondrial-like [Penaeus japonicus]
MLWTSDKTLDILLYALVSYSLGCLVSCLGLLGFWTAFCGAWLLSAGTCLYRASLEITPAKRAVIVTGCDSGFGHAIALQLDKIGFQVFAGCLMADAGGQGAKDLREKGSERLHVVQLDITSNDQIAKAVEYVRNTLKEDEVVWGLVNNAGIAIKGAAEWVPIETFRKVAEVNLFGLIATTKAFLPLVRRAKGRIVNVTSVSGCMGVRICSPYISSKYAVEGFSDCLRLEMKQFGVNVCVVEPGSHVVATQILTKEMLDRQADECWKGMDEETRSAYGEELFRKAYEALKDHGETDIQPVVDAATEALINKYPRARYCSANWPYRVMLFVSRHLPEWVFDALYN